MAQVALGTAPSDKASAANIAKLLTAALKNHDSSLADSGYAFNLAAIALDAKDAKAIFDLIEDAVVQADEVDGKMLQFEGKFLIKKYGGGLKKFSIDKKFDSTLNRTFYFAYSRWSKCNTYDCKRSIQTC